ncbi:MAG: hypothetical protein Q9220_005503 [cf. Caloplaca sp. 1 TL-2023]
MPDSFWSAYHNLITHIVPGPNSISYFVPFLLLPTAFCIPPNILSKWQLASLFLPLILACQLHAWSRMDGLDVISVNVATWSITLLLCYDPRKTFKLLHRVPEFKRPNHNLNNNDTPQREEDYFEESYPSTLSRRIPWVLTLLPSLRLSNWKTGVPAHDRTQPITPMLRSTYLIRATLLAAQSFIILDITSTLVRYDPYFHVPNTSISSPLPPFSSNTIINSIIHTLPPRLLRTTILSAQSHALITQGGALPTLFPVLLSSLGLWPEAWSPHTWPLFFGPFSAVYERGLRGLWGSWWHQTNRYLATPGRYLARKLGARERGMGMYALSVASAFGLSGVMHMGLVPPEPRGGGGMGAGEMRWDAAFEESAGVGVGGGVVVLYASDSGGAV